MTPTIPAQAHGLLYDYIVVGAGTAGCVLAARLSENGDARVLLLEAGGAEGPRAMADPPGWRSLLGTGIDWADATTYAVGGGPPMVWSRGRVLGGSSAINGMTFIRGHRLSYDAWPAQGATGWSFDDLLPAFRRSERTHGRSVLRGSAGPVHVAPAEQRHPLAEAALCAAAAVGHPVVEDIGAGVADGFGWADLNIVGGRRQSAADAYLEPARARANLTIVVDALVERLVVRNGRCTGVRYRHDHRTTEAHAGADVIVCAGAVGSPHLLLRSGIGPADQVLGAGVQPAVDLPGVGANLHDHATSGIVYRSARPVPPAVNNHAEVLGTIRSLPDLAAPDTQIMVIDVPLRAPGLDGPEVGEGYTIMASAMLPTSRGSVRLRDAEPESPPIIDPNYYADQGDVAVTVRALRLAREIGEAEPLAPWRDAEALPGAGVLDDRALGAYVRRSVRSYSHPGGTCRIGVDELAVVDSELRVHGIEHLRVADASVMPSPVSANTNATVYAIAERAAELIHNG